MSYRSSRPPFTSTVAPYMKLAAGLATKAITRAISSGSARRPASSFDVASASARDAL